MGFEDANFFIFVAILLPLYYLAPTRLLQLGVLLAGSLFFYGYGQPALVLLLVGCCLVSAVCSRIAGGADSPAKRRRFAILGVALNLAALAFFKYDRLFASLFLEAEARQMPWVATLLAIPLPIGISFYTFHGISLIVDAYRSGVPAAAGNAPARSFAEHLRRTLLYLVFFPQLISGPISKANYFFPQIGPKRLSDIDCTLALRALIYGYFLKSVVANNLQDLTGFIAYPVFLEFSSSDLLAMLVGYSGQIFADFAGYSLLAIGYGALFGYRLPDNFNMPYIAQTFSEFWTRWHISLSSFLRDYLYFPLGGNRKGPLRTYVNLMAVMVLGGLWHGAALSYAVWGGAHGLALVIERAFRKSAFYRSANLLVATMRMLIVFSVVTVAWLLFKLPDFFQAEAYMEAVFTNYGKHPVPLMQESIGLYLVPVAAIHLWYLAIRHLERVQTPIAQRLLLADSSLLQPTAMGAALLMICLNSGRPSAFIYFQF